MIVPVRNPRRSGFTLVEILIATALTAGLFAGLWIILGIFSALQSRSESHAARAQIVRGLIHQIQDDLNQIVVAPRRRPTRRSHDSRDDATNVPAMSGGVPLATTEPTARDDLNAAAVDEAGNLEANASTSGGSEVDQLIPYDPMTIALRGSSHWMMMDLLQPRDELARERTQDNVQISFSVAGEADQGAPWHCRKRVLYYFVSPELSLVEDTLSVGLTRWEVPASVLIDDLVHELEEGKFGTPNSRIWEQLVPASAANDLLDRSMMLDDEQLSANPAEPFDIPREPIPEIERFFIRYAGDDGWSTSWNSNRQTLPSAIECLVVWRDPRVMHEEQRSADRNDSSPAQAAGAETNERDVRDELEQVQLLAAWERLGQENFAVSPQELPPGFARYLFCVPSAPLIHRTLPELSDQFAAGVAP